MKTPTKPNSGTYVKAKLHQPIILTRVGAALNMEVWSGGRKLGILKVGEGGLEWRAARSREEPQQVSWPRFARLMKDEGWPHKGGAPSF